jgi:putative ABC transport system permease protein
MKLALKNMLHDRVRLLITVLGIAFAVFLMVFQGSLLCGFLSAAARLITAAEADIWITSRGVECFDFPATLSKRFDDVSRGVPGVMRTGRIVTAVAEYRSPGGRHQAIALVGADPDVGRDFPVPRLDGAAGAVDPEGVLIDRSSAQLLKADTHSEIEINRRRAHVLGEVEGFSSFLGCPYVFASYRDAARYIGLRPDDSMHIVVSLKEGFSAQGVKRALQDRLPDVDVLTRAEFVRRSQVYWISQTGAGGGILAAAILGFVIGVLIISQTIYATTMENLDEFATLKALGASRWFVSRIVLVQALTCGAAGCAVGLAATLPMVRAAQQMIPWLYTPWWLAASMAGPILVMCCLAALASIRTALAVEPARVFRG